MTIGYASTIAWKIIDVPVRKDKHVIHGIGQYTVPSLIGATKEVGRDLPDLYGNFNGKLYEIINHQ